MTPRDTAAVTPHPAAAAVRFGPFRFDRHNGILARDGAEVPLPPRVLGVLSFLLDRPGRVVSKQALLDGVWNGAYVTETSLSEAVSLLRQALDDDAQRPRYVQTVHRRGYRFIGELAAVAEAAPRPAQPSRVALAVARPAAAPGELPPAASPEPASSVAMPPEAVAPAPRRGERWRRWPTVAAAVLAFAAGGLAVRLADRPGAAAAGAPGVTRFAFSPPGALKLHGFYPNLAVSPDGRLVVYGAGAPDQDAGLFARDLDDLDSERIPGTTGGWGPFFAPDGQSIAFFTEGHLLRLAVAGGPAVPVASIASEPQGGSWGSDGTIVYSAGRPASVYRVLATGGEPRRLTRPDPSRGEVGHWWPQLLPAGEAVLFTVWATTLHDARVEWLSLSSGERRTVLRGGAGARFADGRLLWARPDGGVVTALFDPRRGELVGPAEPLLAGVAMHPFFGFMQLATGGDTLAYLPAAAQTGERRLAEIAPPAGERPLPPPPRFYRNLEVGPRGMLAATILAGKRSDVWLVDPTGGALTRLTFEGFNIEPVWSPDGAWVAYASNREGPFNIHRSRADGSAPAERLLASPRHQHPTSWSADGRELLMGEIHPETGFDLWVLDLATAEARPLLQTPAHEIHASWSRDGRFVAYATDESGRWEIVVRSYPDFAGRWQVSTEGGSDPFWSRSGRSLLFRRGAQIWEVPVAPSGGELQPGPPRLVAERKGIAHAVAGAGEGGLIAIVEEPAPAPAEVRVVVGWRSGRPTG